MGVDGHPTEKCLTFFLSAVDSPKLSKSSVILGEFHLEDIFFEDFNIEIGDSFKYPKCGKMVDMNHLAYVKQKICNHCFEKVVSSNL